MSSSLPSVEFIDKICALYGDVYDDRIEDCKPPAAGEASRVPGENWIPGQSANHKSLAVFEHELEEQGIKLSSSKIRKILITGGCWSTERSRDIGKLYDKYTRPVFEGGIGLKRNAAVKRISVELGVSVVTVSVNLPYRSVVYKLENKSGNAKRCEKYRAIKSM